MLKVNFTYIIGNEGYQMDESKLNIVGYLSRSKSSIKLTEIEKGADYACLNDNKQITLFYRLSKGVTVWEYIGYDQQWKSSSNYMGFESTQSKLPLLKLVD